MRKFLKAMKYFSYFLVVVVLLALILGLMTNIFIVQVWDGRTNLEIEWIVFDSQTNLPTENAAIDMQLLVEPTTQPNVRLPKIYINNHGKSAKFFEHVECSGKFGWFIDPFYVNLPQSLYQVSASGYRSTEWIELRLLESFQKCSVSNRVPNLL